MVHIDPRERYSERRPSRTYTFRTAEVRTIQEVLEQDGARNDPAQPSFFLLETQKFDASA
ncbi:hypothetical protein [Rubellimicrobium arenae]|uniref:hypothetical protein n=1 Tax=Rubellimicrobium arenae TaxID=2817372 RepID=UPI001B308725|nr:hypothetical protein [Rubellimicrobium arenae]